MPLFTDLTEIKTLLEIDPANTVEDKKLLLMQDMAQGIIERCINRRDIFYSLRTELYSGYGTQKINLRHRPVYTTPTPRVWAQQWAAGNFGTNTDDFPDSSELTYGEGFCLDTPDLGQPSRSGILIRLNQFWNKPAVRAIGLLSPYLGDSFGNVKVLYYGGYTVNEMPSDFRTAAVLLVTSLRYLFPIGMPLGSDSYEGQSISLTTERKDWLLGLVKPLLWAHRNWRV